jgi:hypothetical protein
MLGVELKTGVPAMGRGISNKPLHGWRHQIVMRLKENQFEIPMILLNSDAAPRVLGREGVFEHFIVTLEEGQHRSGVLGIGTPEAKEIRSLWER